MSFSKLNAKAPEFVPRKLSQSPPIPTSLVADPRCVVIPPPLPTAGNVHAYSNVPVVVPVRVVPHHQYQYQLQLVDHTLRQNSHNQNKSGGNDRYQKKQEGVGKSQSQGDGNDKDQVNGASQSSINNGLSDEAAQKLINKVWISFSVF